MKSRFLIISAFAALLLLTGVPAQAAVVTNISVPITLDVFVPCADGGAGEVIEVSGFLHIQTSVTFDQNGGLHFSEQFNPQGVGGVGLTTGDKYRATGLTRDDFSTTSSGVVQFTFVNRFDMVGQGPGNNFSIHETQHVTILSDGTVTVAFDNLSITCK
jgi:hypothetical protein